MQTNLKDWCIENSREELLEQWDYEKNAPLTPELCTPGAGKKVWWRCSLGHEWQAVVLSRKSGTGCPICKGRQVLSGYNDLATMFPDIAATWHPDKNGELTAEQCPPASSKKVWWQCPVGHSWEAAISSRTRGGSGCPYCSGHRVLEGFNDLASVHKDLLLDWDYTENIDINPSQVTSGSKEKVWWKCHICNHKWQTAIYCRADGSGCPACGRKKISLARQTVKQGQALADKYPQIVAEWHPSKNIDLCPEKIAAGSDRVVWWICEKGHEYQMSVYSRVKAKSCPVCLNKRVLSGYNDLLTTHPSVASEWSYERNGELLPEQITYGSGKKIWWKCALGHEWEAVLSSRTTGNKSSCPICAGNVVLAGFNDLETTHPEIAAQWSSKNELTPKQVSKGSEYKAIWVCEKQHEYRAAVASRTNMRSGCPICAKELQTSFPEKTICYYLKQGFPNLIENYRPAWIGKSELDIYIPELNLAVEYDSGAWHKKPEKDLQKDKLCFEQGITLIRVRDYVCCRLENTTSIQIFVKDKGWEELSRSISEIYAFINKNEALAEMPSIDIERDRSEIYELMDVLEKRNSLFERHPVLAMEWDNEKNGYLTAKMVTDHIGRKVWWKCKAGHTWQATVASRVDQNVGCPYCSGRFAVAGETDLATTHPEIAKEWHPTKNGDLTPEKVKAGTNKKVWWMCSLGHEYEAAPASRTSPKHTYSCPVCSGKRVLAGFNDLQTRYPEIAAQWHPTLNGNSKPTDFVAKSGAKVWWICLKGHAWQTSIRHRTNGTGCPICFREKRTKKIIK